MFNVEFVWMFDYFVKLKEFILYYYILYQKNHIGIFVDLNIIYYLYYICNPKFLTFSD